MASNRSSNQRALKGESAMSTGLPYHPFDLQGYVRQSYIVGSLIFSMRLKPKLVRCPCC